MDKIDQVCQMIDRHIDQYEQDIAVLEKLRDPDAMFPAMETTSEIQLHSKITALRKLREDLWHLGDVV